MSVWSGLNGLINPAANEQFEHGSLLRSSLSGALKCFAIIVVLEGPRVDE